MAQVRQPPGGSAGRNANNPGFWHRAAAAESWLEGWNCC